MPNDDYPNGTVLRRRNQFSGKWRYYRVVGGGDKKLRLVHMDGSLRDDVTVEPIARVTRDYEEVSRP